MRNVFCLAAAGLLLAAAPALAAGKPQPLFTGDEVINLTLSGPLNGLSRRATARPEPALLKVEGTAPESLPVALATRGVTRRLEQICSFPPLRVTFTQKPGAASLFRGQKNLKLVTHCKASDKYEQDVLLEYAAYRLYRALTPESFGVRLARINYTGPDGRPIASKMGFFIEDVDDVAARNGKERIRGASRISAGQIDQQASARFAVFEYMISNLDWAMTIASPGESDCCHNSRLLGTGRAVTGLVTVPYDFDYSGLVDAPYAVPPEGVGVANVRTRLYRGFCRDNEQAKAFAASLLPRRAELTGIVAQTPQLGDSTRQRAVAYLGDFFDRIATPAKVAEMLSSCQH